MVDCDFFYRAMLRRGVDFFAGVPDSLLSDFCAYIASRCPPEKHVIAANEGGAVALACGHYLATGRPGLVYMQNSGQGNAVNPLVSLADAEVYGISVLLLIGWRGALAMLGIINVFYGVVFSWLWHDPPEQRSKEASAIVSGTAAQLTASSRISG